MGVGGKAQVKPSASLHKSVQLLKKIKPQKLDASQDCEWEIVQLKSGVQEKTWSQLAADQQKILSPDAEAEAVRPTEVTIQAMPPSQGEIQSHVDRVLEKCGEKDRKLVKNIANNIFDLKKPKSQIEVYYGETSSLYYVYDYIAFVDIRSAQVLSLRSGNSE